ncbi:MAG: hypothetical protein HY701_00275 [Gemmatimonadetes bacterium]|nr:hypothetical protein [Gemmatimonadota bacterium]
MVVWLIPMGLFLSLAALYLGGAPIRIEAKGARELLGLIVTFALYLALWGVLRAVLTGIAGAAGAVAAATILSVVALPWTARIGFRLVGVRIESLPYHPIAEGHHD